MKQFIPFSFIVFLIIGCQSGIKQKAFIDASSVDSPGTGSERVIKQDSISIVPASINGTYHVSENTECELRITIEDSTYHLITKTHDSKGTIRNNKAEGIVTFEGFYDLDSLNLLSGTIQGSEIIIQNYGNSQNPFTFFEACDSKYLVLTKE